MGDRGGKRRSWELTFSVFSEIVGEDVCARRGTDDFREKPTHSVIGPPPDEWKVEEEKGQTFFS